MLGGMSARIVASGGDSTVAALWVVFVVIVVAAIAIAFVVWRRYNQNRHTLRGEGLGPLSAGALLLGELADRPSGAHVLDEAPPTTPADIQERLDEIADLHDRGILDDAEYERQRARMLNP
jgi:Short C-terminal domain